MPRRVETTRNNTVTRIERKVDGLLVAHTKLIEALTELVAKLAHPLVAVELARPKLPPPLRAAAPKPEPALLDPPPPRDPPPVISSPLVMDDIDREMAAIPAPPGYFPEAALEEIDSAPLVPESFADMVAEFTAELDEPPPPSDDFDLWDRRLRIYRRANVWASEWGPRPGQDGCLAPAELIASRNAA
jgi:hypothetical protein